MEDNNSIFKQLEELKGEEQFSVPDGYFQSFPDRIRQRASNQKEAKKMSLYHQLRPQLALAASFVALFLLAYVAFSVFMPKNDQFALTDQEIIIALENDIYEIDENLLTTALAKNEGIGLITELNLTEEEIIQYLSEESDDLGILISD